MINYRYKIIKQLGKGRSKVFLAADSQNLNHEAAIKILPSKADADEKSAFKNEFISLQKFNHPNIVKAYDYGTVLSVEKTGEIETGSKFITEEYFDGKDLLSYQNFSEENLLEIIKQIASVLYYLHQSNYIYYDLKPENILIKEINNKPAIKFIDFGFAQNIKINKEVTARGTAEYIAPEILKNEVHDHRIDLYSFGILLYKIIYKKFPFDTGNEIEIFKAHIEKEFKFDETSYSPEIINVVKKLLEKNPENRYKDSIQLLSDLNIQITHDVVKDWLPVKIFAARRDSLAILKTYLSDDSSGEIFTIKGFEGSGKSTLLQQIYADYDNIIYTGKTDSVIKDLMNKILFNETIYNNLPEELIKEFTEKINNPAETVDEIKSFFSRVSATSKFILLLDDYNNYDHFSLEILKDIIPILQVNKIKIIITENSEFTYSSSLLHNYREVNLTPFTESQVNELIDLSYYDYFPKKELVKLILFYSDLLPGNILSFIRDNLLLNIIRYTEEGIKITTDEKAIELLKSSHEVIYDLKLKSIHKDELQAAQLISLFNINIDENVLASLLDLKIDKLSKIIQNLKQTNILGTEGSLAFSSEGLRRYTYSEIQDKEALHFTVAEKIAKYYPDFNLSELARQYELAKKYDKTYEILKREIEESERINAFSYEKKLLLHILNHPLKDEEKTDIKIQLARLYHKLNEYLSALELLNEVLNLEIDENLKNDLLIVKGSCLIGTGEFEEGKNLLNSLLDKIDIVKKKQTILYEIASAEYDLINYNEAEKICKIIIENSETEPEIVGKCYTLLGSISVYRDNDLDKALVNYKAGIQIYSQNNLLERRLNLVINTASIYSLKGEYKKAELYWENALKSNSSTGNLEKEAMIYLNQGNYHNRQLNLDRSIELYTKANLIFKSLGNRKYVGIVNYNLGEVYLLLSEYQSAIYSLELSLKMFQEISVISEILDVYYLLGKIYYVVSSYDNLLNVINKFRENLQRVENETEHNVNLTLLEIFYSNKSTEQIINSLKSIRDYYHLKGDKSNYFFITKIIVKQLIDLKNFDEAFKELNSDIIINICSANNLFFAEQYYLLGFLKIKDDNLSKTSTIDYLQIAYNSIENFQVTELTWKILLALGCVNKERGNSNKTKEYFSYAASVIHYIGDKFIDDNLKRSYYQSEERNEALKLAEELINV